MSTPTQSAGERTGVRLGILGGGQLGQMLAQAALRQGIAPTVLVKALTDPAAIEGVNTVVGSLDDESALSQLAARCDVLTFENEFLDVPLLRRVLEDHPEVELRPGLESIAVAQDKLSQRRRFQTLGIATAPFTVVHGESRDADLERARSEFPDGFVLKWSRFGYDGRGNLVVRPELALDDPDIADFCQTAVDRGATVYAERLVDFECELALVMTRGLDGELVHFPMVVSRQERGVCRDVLGPARDAGYGGELESLARDITAKIATDLGLTGTLAVEFFLERDKTLLVNEIAPRVHNSGHYTLFGREPSQFDLHVQAVTGAPLAQPAVQGAAVMRNLLGPWTIEAATPCPAPDLEPPEGTELVWYGKQSVSPGRKMAHLTGRAATLDAAEELLRSMSDYEAQVWNRLRDDPHGKQRA